MDIQPLYFSQLNIFDVPEGGSYMAEHENRPIFWTKFGKFVYLLAEFGKGENRKIVGHGNV